MEEAIELTDYLSPAAEISRYISTAASGGSTCLVAQAGGLLFGNNSMSHFSINLLMAIRYLPKLRPH